MKKKYIFIILIFILFFLFFNYKNQKLGNTIIKLSEEKIIENILSGKLNYEAEVKVKVYSNKNENEYMLKIAESGENSIIEGIGENDISGLKIEKKDGNLTIKNTKLKLDKIYEDYKEITDNTLFLNSFSKENDKITYEEDIVKITLVNNNRYIKYKELYLDEDTGVPKKLVIKDSSNNPKIIIEYTSIEIF